MADKYWVGNGGNWCDPAHWAASSGGAGGEAIPSPLDSVFFDANSFTLDDQTVNFWVMIYGDDPPFIQGQSYSLYCKNISFNGVTNSPSFFGYAKLIGGGTIFSNSSFSSAPDISLPASSTFAHIVGEEFEYVYIEQGTYYLTTSGSGEIGSLSVEGGIVILSSDLYCYNLSIALGSTFNSAGYDIDGRRIVCFGTLILSGSTTADLAATPGYASYFEAVAGATITIGANTTIKANNFYGGGFTYGNVIVHDTPLLNAEDSVSRIYGSNTYATLKIQIDGSVPSYQVYFEATKTQSITSAGGFTLENSGDALVTFDGLTEEEEPGTWYIVCSSGTININALSSDNLGTLSNSHASGGATFIAYAEDGGGNTGWDFREKTTQETINVTANFDTLMPELASRVSVAANFDDGMEEQQTEINVSAVLDEISQNDIYLSEMGVTAELTATVNTYEESVSDELNLVDAASSGEDPLAVTVNDSLDLADVPSDELPMNPLITDELELADETTYDLAMAQSMIDEFLLLMDSQELIWEFSDHSAYDDEVLESLVAEDSQSTFYAPGPAISEDLDLADSQDLAWLDSILENFDLSDETGVGWLKELIETLFVYDEVRHGWAVTAESSLILTDAIETLLGIIVDEWITFIDIQSNNWNGREIITEDVTLYDIAGFAKIYADSLTDEINIADVSTYQLTITVLEYLGFTELATALRTAAEAVSDSIDIADSSALAFPQSVESILDVVDLSAVAVQFLHSVQSDFNLADVSSLIKRFSDTLSDPIVFVDTITSRATLYSLIYDTLRLNVLVDLEGEFYECYVLNTPKFHPSMYSGFDFNSFCVFENRAFGANDTGIYELTGDTDAGNTIHTGIIFSNTNFDLPNQKRFRRGYLDMSGTSPKMILETEGGQRQAYAIDEQGKMVASHELKSKSWILSVADFETLSSMKLIPVILTK